MNQEIGSEPNKWQRITDEQWIAFFGPNASYFMRQVERIRSGERPEFLFEGFFLGLTWMLYRKMYLVAFCTLMLILMESTIEEGLYMLFDAGYGTQRWIGIVLSLGMASIQGTFANQVYLWYAEQKISGEIDGKAVHLPEVLLARIASRGGTSWYFILILIGFFGLALVAANIIDLLQAF